MATRFNPLNLKNPKLFGIGLSGIIGRSDKDNLLDLAERCLDKGKVHLILDLSGLSSMGGGGAVILADFQRRLTSEGGEAVFVGAKEMVRRFLKMKFEDLPLRYFATVKDAEADLTGDAPAPVEAAPEPKAEKKPDKKPDKKPEKKPAPTKQSMDEMLAGESQELPVKPMAKARKPKKSKKPDEASSAMNEVLEEFNGPVEETSVRLGRRKDHQYTSLSEAVAALGSWTEYKDHSEYAATLRNLLFSHGLAEDAHLLVEREGMMEDPDQEWQLPIDCSLVRQLEQVASPLTMLDLQEDELNEDEICLLEEINPQIILPVMREDKLAAILLLNRGGEEIEYTVAEHFALELLLQVLERGMDTASSSQAGASNNGETSGSAGGDDSDDHTLPDSWSMPAADDDATAKVLLTLALNLPDADDRPHFWRLFARHSWSALPVRNLAFLGPDMTRPQVMVGQHNHWESLDLGNQKIRQYFKGMQRPVETANIPATFQPVKDRLAECQADWIVNLIWEDECLGTAILGLDEEFTCDDAGDRILRIFSETARLLARFDDNNDNADVNLQLVRILVAQREKRCFGHDRLTQAIVDHVHRLARVMGFPPDQERNLTYGCLLRDIGLIDKDDDLMKPPEEMDPTQWPVYRRHPADGAKLLEELNLPKTIVDVVHCHHERFNGEGFPRGLEGRDIPLAARVVTVVENYVAMVTGTSSHEPIAPQTAARILRDNLGQRYDPDIVGLFLDAILGEADAPKKNKPHKKSAIRRVLQRN